jgi:phospholipase/carboxylesterase
MTGASAAVTATAGSLDPNAPLVVLLHGRGWHEPDVIGLAVHLPVKVPGGHGVSEAAAKQLAAWPADRLG